jgi:hypothetical protein
VNEKFRSVISHSSDDKVKVVWSWHGPKGPIWNTELPNILTLSAVSEGVKGMGSRHFWSDDIWNQQFSKLKDKFEMYTTQGIEHDDPRPFIYPFSMTWRVPFETYFNNASGVLEFSHMPSYLIHLVKSANGYIMIDHSVEAFMSDTELEAMFVYFHKDHQLPMYKIIYLTGTTNAQYVYDTWATRNNISPDREHRMKVIPYCSSREIFYSFYVNGHHTLDTGEIMPPLGEPEYDVNHVPQKLFLTWNRRYRRHRVLLVLLLEKLNLIDRSFISFQKIDAERVSSTYEGQIEHLKMDSVGHARGPIGGIDFYGAGEDIIDDEICNRLGQRLPLIIDGETDINQMCEDFGYTRDFYRDSLVSLITETNYHQNECTLTEKSFKPLYNKHPFIILGVPGALQAIRDMGFKTFSDFWDESYDTLQDPSHRFMVIKEQIEKIALWNEQQILEFRRNVKPILDHNYHMFAEPGSVAISNQIYNHITENFNKGHAHWCAPHGGCHFE